ncbi:hypothetical protein SODALDRAFT_185683 [Sodiomyces alkalinus F11]|uniref:Uncharacterized protein n=1 Tax=Sodiomyces alkalinus (strain CBS 110278 / VKM F-3762 / F11) TaxID=1314773 RepID=A0A3N2PUY1_SODAK|nr:hypothetical protein SODALDRAFT_185683 [Sodiomyces alkalinus F11]ROT38284.1 hypothetical protein SODALDRAFT_185683 [Sodiomyces alkalinus F11]
MAVGSAGRKVKYPLVHKFEPRRVFSAPCPTTFLPPRQQPWLQVDDRCQVVNGQVWRARFLQAPGFFFSAWFRGACRFIWPRMEWGHHAHKRSQRLPCLERLSTLSLSLTLTHTLSQIESQFCFSSPTTKKKNPPLFPSPAKKERFACEENGRRTKK